MLVQADALVLRSPLPIGHSEQVSSEEPAAPEPDHGAPGSEAELESLRDMLLPRFQAGQQGGEAHDVPGLAVRYLGGLVGQQLHTCLCQEAWEERDALVSMALGGRGERAGPGAWRSQASRATAAKTQNPQQLRSRGDRVHTTQEVL